jgi:hypothetical protein
MMTILYTVLIIFFLHSSHYSLCLVNGLSLESMLLPIEAYASYI